MGLCPRVEVLCDTRPVPPGPGILVLGVETADVDIKTLNPTVWKRLRTASFLISSTWQADKMSSPVEKNIDDAGAVEVAGAPQEHTKPVSRLTRWYRSPLFNVVLIGLISFTQMGIWNALNSTGAGGQQEPYLVNGANSLTFGYVQLSGLLFTVVIQIRQT